MEHPEVFYHCTMTEGSFFEAVKKSKIKFFTNTTYTTLPFVAEN